MSKNKGKRLREESKTAAPPAISTIPPLPRLGEVILEVFTHPSLRQPQTSLLQYGDNARLSLLGSGFITTVVTCELFLKQPTLSGSEFVREKEKILSDENYAFWANLYEMPEKLRRHPDISLDINEPSEIKNLFNAYIAAVYIEHGMESTYSWIERLISILPDEAPPHKKQKQRAESPDSEIADSKQMFTPGASTSTATTTPQASQSISSSWTPEPTIVAPKEKPPNPLAPANPKAAFMPMFHETAKKRNVTIEYHAQSGGPSYAVEWTVKCSLNGIVKASGTGPTKNSAKEEAAMLAYARMGWAPTSK